VSDFVDQVGNWQLHCHESTKSGAVDVQQFLKSTEVTILQAVDELGFCFVI
jgi:hypothetical protein